MARVILLVVLALAVAACQAQSLASLKAQLQTAGAAVTTAGSSASITVTVSHGSPSKTAQHLAFSVLFSRAVAISAVSCQPACGVNADAAVWTASGTQLNFTRPLLGTSSSQSVTFKVALAGDLPDGLVALEAALTGVYQTLGDPLNLQLTVPPRTVVPFVSVSLPSPPVTIPSLCALEQVLSAVGWIADAASTTTAAAGSAASPAVASALSLLSGAYSTYNGDAAALAALGVSFRASAEALASQPASTVASLAATAETVATLLRAHNSNATTPSSPSSCGDGKCSLAAESCTSCQADCGFCAYSVTLTSGPNVRDLALKGAFRTSGASGATAPGSVAANIHINHTYSSSVRYQVALLTEATFDSDTEFANPFLTGPPSDCFGGFAFSIKAFPSVSTTALPDLVASLTVSLDLTHVLLASEPKMVFYLRWYNSTSGEWVQAGLASFDAEARAVTVEGVTQPGAYALFGSKASSQSLTEAFSDAIAGLTVNTSDALSSVDNALLAKIDTLLDSVADFLEPGDPPVTLSSPTLIMQAEKVHAQDLESKLATLSEKGCPSVALPDDIGMPDSVSVATVYFTLLRDDDPAVTSGECDAGSIISFSIKDASDANSAPSKLKISNVNEGIEFTFATDPSIPYYQRVCQYFNTSKPKDGCLPLGDPSCLGDWDTTGVERVDEESNGTVTVCRATHLSTFSVGIDFTISAPDISLSNFDPSKSKYVYIIFGSLWFFVGLTALYSKIERNRYDKRQVLIEQGTIVDDEVVKTPNDVDVAPTTGWRRFLIIRTLGHFLTNLKDQHSWISAVWPTGRRIYPKRFMKSIALSASIALAGGLDAVFAYTAVDQSCDGCDKPNSVYINGNRIPLDGFYAFLISLPGLLVLSLTLGMYSAYLDVLRKIAPRRFRAMNAEVRAVMESRGIPVNALSKEVRAALKAARKARGKSSIEPVTKDELALYTYKPIELPEEPDEDEMYNQYLSVSGWDGGSSQKRGTSTRKDAWRESAAGSTLSLAVEDERNASSAALIVSADVSDASDSDDSADGQHGEVISGSDAEDDFQVQGFTGSARRPKKTKKAKKTSTSATAATATATAAATSDGRFAKQPSLDVEKTASADEDNRLLVKNEFSGEIEAVVDRMYFWRRTAFAVAVVLNITGLLLTFFWIGALTEEQQKRWLQSFATFEIIAAVIAAPTFIMIGSAITAMKERHKLIEQQEKEARGELEEEVGEDDVHKANKKSASDETKAGISEELHTTLAQELTGNLFTMNFF